MLMSPRRYGRPATMPVRCRNCSRLNTDAAPLLTSTCVICARSPAATANTNVARSGFVRFVGAHRHVGAEIALVVEDLAHALRELARRDIARQPAVLIPHALLQLLGIEAGVLREAEAVDRPPRREHEPHADAAAGLVVRDDGHVVEAAHARQALHAAANGGGTERIADLDVHERLERARRVGPAVDLESDRRDGLADQPLDRVRLLGGHRPRARQHQPTDDRREPPASAHQNTWRTRKSSANVRSSLRERIQEMRSLCSYSTRITLYCDELRSRA